MCVGGVEKMGNERVYGAVYFTGPETRPSEHKSTGNRIIPQYIISNQENTVD